MVSLEANGRIVHEGRLETDLQTWSLDRPLVIGNEHTGDRPLTATITFLELSVDG